MLRCRWSLLPPAGPPCLLLCSILEAGRCLLLLFNLFYQEIGWPPPPSTHPPRAGSGWHSHCASWGHATSVRLCPFLLALWFTNSFNPLGFLWKQIPFLPSVSLPLKLTPPESPFILLYLCFHLFFFLAVVGLTLPLLFAVCENYAGSGCFILKAKPPYTGWLPERNAHCKTTPCLCQETLLQRAHRRLSWDVPAQRFCSLAHSGGFNSLQSRRMGLSLETERGTCCASWQHVKAVGGQRHPGASLVSALAAAQDRSCSLAPALAARSWGPCGGITAAGETGARLGCSCLQLICWLARHRVSPLLSLEW